MGRGPDTGGYLQTAYACAGGTERRTGQAAWVMHSTGPPAPALYLARPPILLGSSHVAAALARGLTVAQCGLLPQGVASGWAERAWCWSGGALFGRAPSLHVVPAAATAAPAAAAAAQAAARAALQTPLQEECTGHTHSKSRLAQRCLAGFTLPSVAQHCLWCILPTSLHWL